MQSYGLENDYSHVNKTHCHKKGFALSPVFENEFLELRNGLIDCPVSSSRPRNSVCNTFVLNSSVTLK